jgi:hypothetical protein
MDSPDFTPRSFSPHITPRLHNYLNITNYDTKTNTNTYKDNLNLLDQRDYQMVVMIVSLLQEHLIIRVIMMKKMVDLTQPERE